jgi:hypothetical protein
MCEGIALVLMWVYDAKQKLHNNTFVHEWFLVACLIICKTLILSADTPTAKVGILGL